ncbi:MAG: iron-containing alcohol dehydrogenase [Alphaproteobacteria bacterium]|nr:iron-containing alcohol dehydrogenase [Alphaproteobacteria bacterium]
MDNIIDSQIIARLSSLIAPLQLGKQLLVVCDSNTWKAAGERVFHALGDDYQLMRVQLEEAVIPSITTAQRIIALAGDMDALVAVGSGTINDLTKYAAHKVGKPYITIATAASMNGYAAANASLWDGAHKTSQPATAPKMIIADTEILAESPTRLTSAGFADMLCRSTVQADMFLSHHILGTPYHSEAFAALEPIEQALLPKSKKLTVGDEKSLNTLMQGLIIGGQWMSKTGSSATASQGEHMIAHAIEMLYPKIAARAYHGELVAVATVSMAKIQQRLLSTKPQLRKPATLENIQAVFGKELAASLFENYQHKAAVIQETLDMKWPEISAGIFGFMIPAEILTSALDHAGAPTKPEHIGLTEDQYSYALEYAHWTRDRFSFLDLV